MRIKLNAYEFIELKFNNSAQVETPSVSDNETKEKHCAMKSVGCPYINNSDFECSECQFYI